MFRFQIPSRAPPVRGRQLRHPHVLKRHGLRARGHEQMIQGFRVLISGLQQAPPTRHHQLRHPQSLEGEAMRAEGHHAGAASPVSTGSAAMCGGTLGASTNTCCFV